MALGVHDVLAGANTIQLPQWRRAGDGPRSRISARVLPSVLKAAMEEGR